jgi:hypothetical protein
MEQLHSILTEIGIPVKIARLNEMCLNETYSKACLDKHLSYAIHIQNGLNQGDALSSLLFNFYLDMSSRRSKKIRKDWN